MMLRAEELREQILKDTRIFHFGTLSMTDEPVRSATRHAIETAKANGALLSFDPNIREPLWQSMEEAKRQTAYGMEVCDVLKISDNEIRWFTGEKDFDRGVDKLWREYHIPLILLSMGSGGSRAYCGSRRAEQPAFLQEGTIETTGAGDTFGACCLHYILEHGVAGLGTPELEEMLRFANTAASIVTTRRGALRVMPEPEEIHMIEPRFCSRNMGISAWVMRKVPFRFTLMTASHCSSVIFHSMASRVMEALLTSTSQCPHSC